MELVHLTAALHSSQLLVSASLHWLVAQNVPCVFNGVDSSLDDINLVVVALIDHCMEWS